MSVYYGKVQIGRALKLSLKWVEHDGTTARDVSASSARKIRIAPPDGATLELSASLVSTHTFEATLASASYKETGRWKAQCACTLSGEPDYTEFVEWDAEPNAP